MASSEAGSGRQNFHVGLFGYRRSEVDRSLEELGRLRSEGQEELARAREASDTVGALSKHLAALMTRFAESVSAGEQAATEQADAIVADARTRAEEIEAEARHLLQEASDLAAATFAEAGRRYEAMTAARQTASARIEDAIEQMADALAALAAVPELPELSLPTPVPPASNVFPIVDPAGRATEDPVETAETGVDADARYSTWMD